MIKIINGEVIKGKQLGRKIGFPTANISCDENIEDASYKVNILIEGKLYHGAGVYRKNIKIFEVNIFDFDKDIYGKNIEIIILTKIRDNKKISSLKEVKLLIENDIKTIKKVENNVLTFGTFDKVHKGHGYYLNESTKYGDKLITIVATNKNVEKLKGKKTNFDIIQRIADVKKLNISDEVLAGDENNPLKWIETYKPTIICLGYDQVGFSDKLDKYIKENNLNTEVIRIKPFMENIYKSSLIK